MRMLGKSLLVFLLAGVAGAASAMWVSLSPVELVQSSEVIAVGEYLGQARVVLGQGAVPRALGVIRVDEVLKGDKPQNVLLVDVPAGPLRPSSDIVYRVGQRGLWYLKAYAPKESGIYVADHPQRFVPIERAAEQIRDLREARPR